MSWILKAPGRVVPGANIAHSAVLIDVPENAVNAGVKVHHSPE